MATIKAYTDLEQSKKLAKILPLESADMYYACGATTPNVMIGYKQDYKCYTMCWSLAALLEVLNKKAHSLDEDGAICFSSYKGIEWDLSMQNTDLDLDLVTKSNPVDACVAMIENLHEQNLL